MTKSKKIVCGLSALLFGLVAVIMPFVLKPKQSTFALDIDVIDTPSVDPSQPSYFVTQDYYLPLAITGYNDRNMAYGGVYKLDFMFTTGLNNSTRVIFSYPSVQNYTDPIDGTSANFRNVELYQANYNSTGTGTQLDTSNVSSLGGLSYNGYYYDVRDGFYEQPHYFTYAVSGWTSWFCVWFTNGTDGALFNSNISQYYIDGTFIDNNTYFTWHYNAYNTYLRLYSIHFICFNGATCTITLPIYSNVDVPRSVTYYTSDAIPKDQQYNIGYNDGYMVGEDTGYTSGYDAGETAGYNRGKEDGYNIGRVDGIMDSNNYSFLGLIGATVDAPITALTGLLNFEILGVNLSSFFFGLFTVTLLIIVIRYIKGGGN